MITYLVKTSDKYICGNCRMQQPKIKETCWFCGHFFSNYEEILVENYEEQLENEK